MKRAPDIPELQAHLARRPEDVQAWLALARQSSRRHLAVETPPPELLGPLLELWRREPGERDLERLVLPMLGLDREPGARGRPPSAWWRQRGRVAAGSEGAYDTRTGLPLTARHRETGLPVVWIPAGTFAMGSLAFAAEQPIHEVAVDGFYLGRSPVPVHAFAEYTGATGARPPPEWDLQLEAPERPVVFVDWEAAEAFCAWAGGRLPREAEWEWAARGDDGRFFPWGDALPHVSWVNLGRPGGHPERWDRYLEDVEARPSDTSPFGALDLGGNVQDWCADWFQEGYGDGGRRRNPQGPSDGGLRVVRGGCWQGDDASLSALRATTRRAQRPAARGPSCGFRLLVEVPGGDPAPR